jgi:outer membrane receptor for ferrienterochelin and colicin
VGDLKCKFGQGEAGIFGAGPDPENTFIVRLRRPANKLSLAAIWQPTDQFSLSTTVLYVSSWVDVNRDTAVFIPRLDAPAYTTVNLAANYEVDKHVTVFGRIDNLFNRQYENPLASCGRASVHFQGYGSPTDEYVLASKSCLFSLTYFQRSTYGYYPYPPCY